jgi:non-canonical poly(A) RNA polymerase PAPD5/7
MSDSYRPAQPKSSEYRPDVNTGHSRPRQERNQQSNRERGGARNRGNFTRKAAERPFLITTRASTPELMPGMEEGDGPAVKYRALEELSDSDEADMDVSTDDENESKDSGSEEQPRKKQARTDLNKSADGESVPRWSNPDPYTVLPPPDESQRKKMDVVKLIRKARVVSSSDAASKPEVVTDDFISFDFNDEIQEDDDEDEEMANDQNGNGVPGAPTGPRGFSHRENVQKFASPRTKDGKPGPPALDISSDPALSSRKRTIDDKIKDPPAPPAKFTLPKGASDGTVVGMWRVIPGASPTPWCTVDHAATENMGYW